MKRPRVPREIEELVEALRQHTDLLADYGQRAFGGGDERYLGEVAGKLRLLVYDRGRNRPLLLDLMQAFGLDVQVTLNGPPQFEIAPGLYGGGPGSDPPLA